MRQHGKQQAPQSAEETVRDIRRATRRQFLAEEKIRIVVEGLRGENSIAELCRKEGIAQNLYYRWSKEFLEAGKKRLSGLTDLTVRADEFSRLSIDATRVFVVENEINGLAFPPVAGGLVIFGLGYAIDLIRAAEWLGRRELHYWGDLGTHGFAMLDRLRETFPDARSLLMDRNTLVANMALWGPAPAMPNQCGSCKAGRTKKICSVVQARRKRPR